MNRTLGLVALVSILFSGCGWLSGPNDAPPASHEHNDLKESIGELSERIGTLENEPKSSTKSDDKKEIPAKELKPTKPLAKATWRPEIGAESRSCGRAVTVEVGTQGLTAANEERLRVCHKDIVLARPDGESLDQPTELWLDIDNVETRCYLDLNFLSTDAGRKAFAASSGSPIRWPIVNYEGKTCGEGKPYATVWNLRSSNEVAGNGKRYGVVLADAATP